MTTIYRAQVVMKHTDALQRDALSNVFHVKVPASGAPTAEAIAEAVRDFYTATPAGEAGALYNFFGAQIANTGHEVRMYRYEDTTAARVPYDSAPPDHVEVFDLLSRGTPDASLASEVAVAVTLRNLASTSIPLAQRSGRVFIGGLDTGCTAQVSGVARPSAAFRSQLLNCAKQLVANLHTLCGASYGLIVWSRPYAGRAAESAFRADGTALPALPSRVGAARLVDQVSVDDAFDTQRRRGERALARTVATV